MKIIVDGEDLDATVVPNTTSGYEIVYLLDLVPDTGKVQLTTGPVIGWAIFAYDEKWNAEPVGIFSLGSRPVGLKHPDGKITQVDTWGIEAMGFGRFVFAPCSDQSSRRALCDEHCPEGHVASVDALSDHLTKQREFERKKKRIES